MNDAIEYGFIHITDGTVHGLRPASMQSIAAAVPNEPFDSVMQKLIPEGWRISPDSEYTGHEEGKYQVKIERPVVYQGAPESTTEFNYFIVKCSAADLLHDVQHRFEVMGADLMQIIRPTNDQYPHLLFRVPKRSEVRWQLNSALIANRIKTPCSRYT